MRALADRLKNFERLKRDGVSNVDEDRLARLAKELEDNEGLVAELKEKLTVETLKLSDLSGEFDSLMERITAAGGGGGDTATYKDYIEEREQFKNQLRDTQRRMEEILAGKLPLRLVLRQVIDTLRDQLQAEARLHQWESEKQALEPRQREFLVAFDQQAHPDIEPPLTTEQVEALRTRLNSAWAALFYPAPDDCAKFVDHSYLSPEDRVRTLRALDEVAVGQQEIQDVLRQQTEFETKIDDLSRK